MMKLSDIEINYIKSEDLISEINKIKHYFEDNEDLWELVRKKIDYLTNQKKIDKAVEILNSMNYY